MNTDNMSILGLTIDYGPFGFLDAFVPNHVCNHSDNAGRYAWSRQPNVGFWNLHALAQALLPLIDDDGDAAGDAALAELDTYKQTYADAMLARWRAKLGLRSADDADRALVDDLLRLMATDASDFTLTWRALCGFDSTPGATNSGVRDHFVDRAAFDAWAARYAQRLGAEGSIDAERALRMRAANPKFVLRNHLAELAIRAANQGDFGPTERLLKVLRAPFDESPPGVPADEIAAFAGFPPEWAQAIEVSCSS
jgi:uncharacterized protein YdiU (UPF0061 family)